MREATKKSLSFYTVFFAIFIIIWVPFVHASPQPLRFERISIQDGLSQASVLCILQDSMGFLWFGTYEGLNRYDGSTFVAYKNELKNPNSLSDNAVRTLIEDRNGVIWVGTSNGGLNRYEHATGLFRKYSHDPEDPDSISSDEIQSLYEDDKGRIWVGTLNGLNVLDPKTGKFQHYFHDEKNANSISNSRILSIWQDPDGDIWTGTYAGLNKIDPATGDVTRYVESIPGVEIQEGEGININSLFSNSPGTLWVGTDGEGLLLLDTDTGAFSRYLDDYRIYDISLDEEGALWIGTNAGLVKCVHKANNLTSNPLLDFTVYTNNEFDPESLSHNDIRSTLIDASGILWLGTYGDGICKMNPAKQVFGVYRNEPWNEKSISSSHVTSIYEDLEGKLWIGTYDKGINIIDRDTGEIVHRSVSEFTDEPTEDNTVQCIIQDVDGVIWFGTQESGLIGYNPKTGEHRQYIKHDSDPKSISQDNIYWLHEDKDGFIWVGTSKKGLNRFDKKSGSFKRYEPDPDNPKGLSHKRVRHIMEDSRGRMWLGTNNGLNLLVNREAGEFKHWEYNPDNPAGISNNRVTPIVEDKNGKLWIGTDKGLNLFDPDTEQFTTYTEKDGLANDAIQGLMIDKNGCLWMSTFKGISRLDPSTGNIRNFSPKDGLQGIEFWMNTFHKNKQGEMFFGGLKGLTFFLPENIKENRHIPPVVLTGFKVMNKPYDLPKSITVTRKIDLSYKDLFFSFEFAALDYFNPQNNQYAYKLEGFDDDWVYAGNMRNATYTNFDHGDYIFRVRASNSDGVWNDQGATVKIHIIPPFWKTLWFRMLAAAVSIALIYGIFAMRIRSLNMQKRKLDILVAERTAKLEEEITERKQIEEELQVSRNRLEERVLERTAELESVNIALKDSERKVRENYNQLKETQQKLVEHVTLLQTMIDSIPASIFYKDLNGCFLGCNTTFSEFTGKTREEIIGRTVSDLLPQKEAKEFTYHDDLVFSNQSLNVYESRIQHANGLVQDVILFKAPFYDAQGSLAGLVGFMMDISERKKAEEDLLNYQDKLKKMGSELSLAEERERRRIAVDLHDHLGQALALSKLRISSLVHTLKNDNLAQPLMDISQGIDQMIKETRSLTMKISPPVLYDLGFEAAVEWLTEQLCEEHDINFIFKGGLDLNIRNHDVRVILYRVTRELLMNVIKHARADKALVSIQRKNSSLMITVEDNGVGLGDSYEAVRQGKTGTFGLFSVRERLEPIGGKLEIDSSPGEGTRACVVVGIDSITSQDSPQ